MLFQRVVESWPGRSKVIRTDTGYLYVENRELFTSYRLETPHGRILWHDVRNCVELPSRNPRIIYARTIPWFMWLWYGLLDIPRKLRERKEFQEWAIKEKKKQKTLISYQREVRLKQFVGKSRYSR